MFLGTALTILYRVTISLWKYEGDNEALDLIKLSVSEPLLAVWLLTYTCLMKLGGVLFSALFGTPVSDITLLFVGMLFADRLELSFLRGLDA